MSADWNAVMIVMVGFLIKLCLKLLH
jgi:hypothetical protein